MVRVKTEVGQERVVGWERGPGGRKGDGKRGKRGDMVGTWWTHGGHLGNMEHMGQI